VGLDAGRPSTLDPYFEKMAAQGQSFFVASGDSSTWSKRQRGLAGDDAHIISVGGTDLVTASAGGAWKSETAWVDSGGGISPDKIAIPPGRQISGVINSSQQGLDDAAQRPGRRGQRQLHVLHLRNQTTCQANEYGGTSFAAPMWAGLVALANQQAAQQRPGAVGFFNPTIYAQNVTSSYATGFHDITSGKSGSYSAVTGYDLVTGWGSPKATLTPEQRQALRKRCTADRPRLRRPRRRRRIPPARRLVRRQRRRARHLRQGRPRRGLRAQDRRAARQARRHLHAQRRDGAARGGAHLDGVGAPAALRLHPTSHLAHHEEQAFAALMHLHAVPVGDRLRPMTAADLEAIASRWPARSSSCRSARPAASCRRGTSSRR
jgi:hypothetical protein